MSSCIGYAGGARTGPDGPIVVDKTAAPQPMVPVKPAAKPTPAPTVKQYGTPVGEKKDTDILTDPNAPDAGETESGSGFQEQPRRKTVMPELPNAEMIMQLNASTKKYEAYGVKGMNSSKWRKQFDSYEQAEAWAEKNNAEIQGFRETEGHMAASYATPFECLECGKKFRSTSGDPHCPKCGSTDIDVDEAIIASKQAEEYTQEPSPNGLSYEEAEQILAQIGHGDRVTIMIPAGRGGRGQEWSQATGKAVMRNDYGWALNMGGAHGTPGVATARNIVSVRKSKAGSIQFIAAKDPGVWKRLREHWPGEGTISFSNKSQEYIVKEGYFYRHGRSAENLEAAVKKVIPEAQITSTQDHWNPWPRNSWFEVRFKVPVSPEQQAKAANYLNLYSELR